MNRRALLANAAALSTPILAGCAGGDDGGGTPTPTPTTAEQTPTPTPETTTAAADATVDMINTTFDPATLEVEVGATVRWVNQDAIGHDVTSAQFSSGAASWTFKQTVSSGGATTYTFENEGVYEYYCSIHGKGTMCGVVLVGDVTYDGSLPCQDGDTDGGYGY